MRILRDMMPRLAALGFLAAFSVNGFASSQLADSSVNYTPKQADKELPEGAYRCNTYVDNGQTKVSSECGWWFDYYDAQEKVEEDEEPEKTAVTTPESPEEKEKRCSNKETWEVKCGFIDPGNDFDFQALQRDKLYRHAVMNPKDSKAIEAFQYYHKWIVNQAILVANMWEWNRVQNNDLDPTLSSPISHYGVNLMRRYNDTYRQGIFDVLRDEGGFYVWFTKESCVFCHDMLDVVKAIARETDLPVYNASIEGDCLDGFEGEFCSPPEESIPPAQMLKVKYVPTLFLYLPNDQQWIRISTGVDAQSDILSRTTNFFEAVTNATAKAVSESIADAGGNKEIVDFEFRSLRDQIGLSETGYGDDK